MSKRLQVLLDESELDEIRTAARQQRMTVSEWVRQSLRRAREQAPAVSAERKLEAIRRATEHSFPTAEIDDMLREIESGYAADVD